MATTKLLTRLAIVTMLTACDAQPAPSAEFDAFATAVWAGVMEAYPEWSTLNGMREHNESWTDISPDGFRARREQFAGWHDRLLALDRNELAPARQLSYDVLDDFLTTLADAPPHDRRDPGSGYGYTLLSQMEGLHHRIPVVVSAMPHESVEDYEVMLRRLEAVAPAVEQGLATLTEDVAAGIVLPRIVLRDVPAQIGDLLTADPHDSAVLAPFQQFPAVIGEADRGRLREEAAAVFTSRVAPALESLQTYLGETYLPAARETVALTELPGGAEWYDYKVRLFTTTELSVAEIHELGISEVERIRRAMEEIIEEVGFAGDFAAFSEFLRTDSRFYFSRRQDLLSAYRDISKRADPKLVALFGRLPRLPYGVEAVPSYSERSQTTAYYQPGSPEANRAGTFFANTYNLASRPMWEMEALTLHEAVPGHHLQIAIAQELEGVAEFRKHLLYNAYTEGWGLYSESLGYEMGFYEDPYSRFGQLTYEIWRAIRLVVDTGLHGLGWSRGQAIRYFAENASKTEHDITVEVDRYIAWPGQALGYKIGQLEIQRLRREAEAELGERFDVRAFHDLILGQGGLPLTILAERVEEWVEEQE